MRSRFRGWRVRTALLQTLVRVNVFSIHTQCGQFSVNFGGLCVHSWLADLLVKEEERTESLPALLLKGVLLPFVCLMAEQES